MQGNVKLLGLEENSVQSHDLRYIDYLVPGILGMSLMFTGIFGGLPIIQQRQARIIKRLGCTPLRRSILGLRRACFQGYPCSPDRGADNRGEPDCFRCTDGRKLVQPLRDRAPGYLGLFSVWAT